MHGIYYVPLLIFIIPYLLNSFKYKFKFLNNGPVNYNRKPLFITYLISMLVGFINPYTYKIYPYGFSSYGDATMRENIRELAPITFNSFFGKICIITMIVTFIIYIVNTKKKKIPLRYYLLLLGTFVLALDAYKSFYIFMTCFLWMRFQKYCCCIFWFKWCFYYQVFYFQVCLLFVCWLIIKKFSLCFQIYGIYLRFD